MLKRTLYFGNAAYLSFKDNQLVVKTPDGTVKTAAIEDVGFVILDNSQITLSNVLLSALLENNCAVISCDRTHLPNGLFLPLSSNTLQSERFQAQINASLPLKKQLWQQTVQQKILNQAKVLQLKRNQPAKNMIAWANAVRSGDVENREAVAAAYYWKELFPHIENFTRDRYGVPPNNLLNYGYAILRGVVDRSLVASGLLPTLGIHHHNRYNAYCLADDMMEPYRPIVDKLIIEILDGIEEYPQQLTKEHKIALLKIPVLDVWIDGKRSPLMNAVSTTTTSLFRCYAGELRKVVYPEVPDGTF
ncbi:type II CRISPR-associated endonuclease Cas1 [uncultured Fibrobacter sp.]|uniref:type II CRISPR-associated endonuclease Cas1 n=1 Tax=uncultured Fibrobacter sp. TaxID=261512 RepID=UPI002803B2B1|nr:type II CRISPR-associated endonuclease Cas1 [uncultured Fibrobacter sp.]